MEIIRYADGIKFRNRHLNASTKRIMREGRKIKKSFYKIAKELAIIEDKKLYIEDGFDNTIDYAKKILGLSKTNAYYLIAVGRDYTDDGEHSILTHDDGKDYTIGQLKVLMPLGIDKVKEMDADGVIHPSMSVRSIARAVNAHTEEESEIYDPEPRPPLPVITVADGELFFNDGAGVDIKILYEYIQSLLLTMNI